MLIEPAINGLKRKKQVSLYTIVLVFLLFVLILAIEMWVYADNSFYEGNEGCKLGVNKEPIPGEETNKITDDDIEAIRNIKHVEELEEFGEEIRFIVITIDDAKNYQLVKQELDEQGFSSYMQNADLERRTEFIGMIKSLLLLMAIAVGAFIVLCLSLILKSIKLEEKQSMELLKYLGYNNRQLKQLQFIKNAYICYKSYIIAFLLSVVVNPIINNILCNNGMYNFLKTNFVFVNFVIIFGILLYCSKSLFIKKKTM